VLGAPASLIGSELPWLTGSGPLLRGERMEATVQRRIRLAIEEAARSSSVPVKDLSINQVDEAIRRDLSPDELRQINFEELFGIWHGLADEG
jgi:hypothetical protein